MPNKNKPAAGLDMRIGLWGPRNAGKTSYIATLYRECLLHSEWDIRPADDDTTQFVMDAEDSLSVGGFVKRSDPNVISHQRFDIQWRTAGLWGPRAAKVLLDFPDAAGEWYDNYAHAQATWHAAGNPLPTLLECQELLILLDPEPEIRMEQDPALARRSYFAMLAPLMTKIAQLRETGARCPSHAALVLTKVDDPRRWPMREQITDLVRENIPDVARRVIYSAFPSNHKWFAVSSVGILEQPGLEGRQNFELRANDDGQMQGAIVDPEHVKPYNVLAPLEWLIRQACR